MHSLLGVPVVSHGRILGNLYLTDKQGEAGFDERDEDLLRLLSTQAAVAIRNAELYEAERSRASEWEALFDLSRELTFSAELDDLLDSVVQRATRLLNAEIGIILLSSPDDDQLRIAAQCGLRTSPPRSIALPPRSLLVEVIRSGLPAAVSNRRTDERVRADPLPLLDEEGVTSVIQVPLKGKDHVIGLLIAGSRVRTTYATQQIELLETFANLSVVAIETRELYNRLESLTRLEERERIGMDLHDGVIQSIYAVSLHLEDTSDRLPDSAKELRPEIEKAMDDLNKVMKDIRSYIFDLRPQLTQVDDLPGAVKQLVEQFRVNTLIPTTLDISDPFHGAGGESAAMALFHIAQEALNNAGKHSKATAVSVRLLSSEQGILLEVTDNGVGFEVPQVAGVLSSTNGLRNMRDRARSVGADLAHESSPGNGATVRVSLQGR
jgi:signal transduction histidine kinase